jgi:hypothetical protein
MAKAQAEPAQQKSKGGRPTKFDAKLVKQARELALLGLTDAEIARVFDVATSTFKEWKAAHPAFARALIDGKTIADAQVAASLHHRAVGYSHPETVINAWQGTVIKTRVIRHYPPDTQAALKWLHNRRPSLWRTQPEPTDEDEAPTPVKVTVQVVSARKRPDDADPE